MLVLALLLSVISAAVPAADQNASELAAALQKKIDGVKDACKEQKIGPCAPK